MKKWKLVAVLCAALLTLGGCGKNEPDFAKEEELPYGATMRSDKTGFAVPITYDRRFLDETQVAVVADLLASVQNVDAALYESAALDFYVAYQMDIYEYENVSELLENFHASLVDSSGEDFQFGMVLINSFTDNRNSEALKQALEMLDDIYEGDGKFSDTVENALELTVEWDISYDDGNQTSVIEGEHIFLFQTADGCFGVM